MQWCSLYRVHKVLAQTDGTTHTRTQGTKAALLYPHRNALRGDKKLFSRLLIILAFYKIIVFFLYLDISLNKSLCSYSLFLFFFILIKFIYMFMYLTFKNEIRKGEWLLLYTSKRGGSEFLLSDILAGKRRLSSLSSYGSCNSNYWAWVIKLKSCLDIAIPFVLANDCLNTSPHLCTGVR